MTGIITDADKVSALLHKYGAMAFWDYATAGELRKIIFVFNIAYNLISFYFSSWPSTPSCQAMESTFQGPLVGNTHYMLDNKLSA